LGLPIELPPAGEKPLKLSFLGDSTQIDFIKFGIFGNPTSIGRRLEHA